MNKFKVLIPALIILSVAFTNCKKDEPDAVWNVEAQVPNGTINNSPVDSVYAYIDTTNIVVGKSKYANGSFKINLSTPPASALLTFADYLSGDVSISNKKAKLSTGIIFKGIKDGRKSGTFVFTSFSMDNVIQTPEEALKNLAAVSYIYADSDVTIKGTMSNKDTKYSFTIEYNLTLKHGWNIVATKVMVDNETEFSTKLYSVTNTKGYGWIYIPEGLENMKNATA